MDTFGSLIDKLLTVNLKTINKIRAKDTDSSINLSAQKDSLIKEIDALDNKLSTGEIDKQDIIRPQHKTY